MGEHTRGQNLYLDETNFATSGNEVDLILTTPVRITPQEPVTVDELSVSYMLAGEGDAIGVSNTDPFAPKPTNDNDWVKEGPHLMILAPTELLEGYPADPENGGPYVMWKGTPYAHLMVPVGSRD